MKHESILHKKIELKPFVTEENLKSNESICTVCNGVGKLLKNEKWLIDCPHCYCGVNKKCENCGETIIRPDYRCQNQSCIAELDRKRVQNIIEKAIKVKHDVLKVKEFKMMYSDFYKYNEGYFADWEDFFDYWYEYHKDEERPQYVFGTTEIKLSIDVDSILLDACDDLHEDAYDRLEDIGELQDFLNKWCEKQTGATSYCEDYTYAIEIPWELYK